MIPVGQAYIPTGGLHFRGLLTALILGFWGALLSAGLIWLWEISPVPTLLLFTPIVQGFLVGLVTALVFSRMKMRNPRLAMLMGFAFGLLSIGLVHFGHHVRLVHQIRDEMRSELNANARLNEAQKRVLRGRLDTEPFRVVDQFFLHPQTRRHGFLATMQLRNEMGVTLKSSKVTGTGLWVLWGIEALAVAGLAGVISRQQAALPFCEECHAWCNEQKSPGGIMPGSLAEPLAEAIRVDDPAGLMRLKDREPAGPEPSVAVATLHSCPTCDLAFADLVLQPGEGKQQKVRKLISRLSVSPAMATALFAGPKPAPTPETPLIPEGESEPAGEA